MRSVKFWLLAAFLTIPAFGLMLRPGIFSMHDPHLFRIQQFDLCAESGTFPCRWSPDSSKGYGSPLFNFYAQAPYWLTQVFRVAGASLIDSAKIAYIFSLVASGLTMFLLSRKHWGNFGGLISSVFYVFAPYRAVDVWVRGALPEALAFVYYPLILYFLDEYLKKREAKFLAGFSLFTALLLLTHNLSFLMFLPFLVLYWMFRSWQLKAFRTFPAVSLAGILSLGLSAFYLLPVIFESSLVTLTDTVSDYYNFQIHFTTLNELFISRFWGYGASLWAQKYLSVSIGQLHWLVPLIVSVWAVFKLKKDRSNNMLYLFIFFLGILALFLTHGKSLFIWKLFPPLKYIQFPWRFLTVAVFFLSLAAGYAGKLSRKFLITGMLVVSVILVNVGFFRPDIWQVVSDADLTSGRLWDEGRSSSLTDFWPNYGPPPVEFAGNSVDFAVGNGWTLLQKKQPHFSEYVVRVDSPTARIILPQVYFPGWVVYSDAGPVPFEYTRYGGLISLPLNSGNHHLTARFIDTSARHFGNYISLVSLLVLVFGSTYLISRKKVKHET